MKDFDQFDFLCLLLLVSHSSSILKFSVIFASISALYFTILKCDSFLLISSLIFLKSKLPLTDPKVIVF